ncbi:SPOR domain-containing protein [Shinella sp. CPCC 100929]|uniref:SPOR domain-containing protein n=1 Tax=Shinella lacus TaxID=2654216 RepID=A0ABT1R3W7_9HYPH|nr:SPOR domain-containing protein [Shinella lacus]MCQ4629882.1 SPOR domain-containing protein [Shinella lacus]
MAEKNFARSGTADTDLLADDDPLAELARLVGYEPRPLQDVRKPSSEPVADAAQTVPRRDNPVLALEDELMRAFEQYDTPSRVAVAPVVAERAAPRHVEPVFDAPEPVAEESDAVLDEVPTRGVVASDIGNREPSFEEPSVTEQAIEPSFEDALIVGDPQYGATLSDIEYREPAFKEPVVEPIPVEEEVVADVRPAEPEPELEFDPALLLADELETAVHEDVPAVEAEPTAHAGLKFVERLEPRFEQRSEPVVETYVPERTSADERQPAFLGFQPHAADENPLDDVGLDLERELELSIGDGFADDLLADDRAPREHSAEASFVEPLPVTVEADGEPNFDGWMPDEAVREDAEPFHAESVYARDEPHFVAEMPFENREDRARAVAEAETQWQAEEPTLEAEPDYRVESVEPGQNYDRDALLAEVERYPVPETRSSLAAVTATPRTTGGLSSIFGRATPVAHRQPVAETARTPFVETVREPVFEPVQSPVIETRQEPVAMPTPVAAEPDLDFENLEFDLSDIDLDLSDFSLDDEPVKEEVKAEVARPVEVVTPVRREPAVAVPVSTYTAPQPVITETADGALPFDPAMIADTDEGVSPVTELDVPQLPVIEKEKPPVYQPDYDFDIDAEMAQLFTEPSTKARTEDLQAGVAAGAVAAAAAQPTAQINDVDDFERALEEDFRRSLSQPERMAIPVDPGQASTLYTGDGYDDEQARPRRGLLIAASIAALLLVGGGGVYAWTAFTGGTAGSGEPRVILADKTPVKIVPEEKGGKTVPNQDKAVYDRVAGDAAATPQQEQLVTSTEEPVDVVQRTLTPETLPFDGPEDGVEAVIQADDENRLLPGVDEPQTATAEGGNKPLVSPRKVKTMIVKPDGTLVAREETVTEPVVETADIDAKATATTGSASGEAVATANATIDADASLSAEQAASEGQPRSALAEVADAEVDDTAPVRTVKTTTIGATDTSTDGNAPVPETRPIDQPVTVVGTVTENGNVSGTQTAEAKPAETQQTAEQTQVAAVAPGSYVIQIASLPSEAEAQKSYNSLSSKFSSVIGGRGVDIKKAEIPNKGTFFRVRIPVGSREEANSLCSRYKSAGGSCLVTR